MSAASSIAWPSAALAPDSGSSNATGTLLPGGNGAGWTAAGGAAASGGGAAASGGACGAGRGAVTVGPQAASDRHNNAASQIPRGREGIERTPDKEGLPRGRIARRA